MIQQIIYYQRLLTEIMLLAESIRNYIIQSNSLKPGVYKKANKIWQILRFDTVCLTNCSPWDGGWE